MAYFLARIKNLYVLKPKVVVIVYYRYTYKKREGMNVYSIAMAIYNRSRHARKYPCPVTSRAKWGFAFIQKYE